MTPSAVTAREQVGQDQAQVHAEARRAVGVALLAALALAAVLQALLQPGPAYLPAAGGMALLGALAVLRYLPGRHPHPRFGPANAVTLARAACTVPIAALIVAPATPGAAVFVAAAGTLVAVLDGVDGRLARRDGLASEFGARFDMETDALLVLALSALAWRWDRAGVWVLASGLLRYAFVAAGAVAPWLRAVLPPGRRRQTICVVQIVVLLAVVAPLLPRALSAPLAFAGLLALLYSFAVDVALLARTARHAPGQESRR